MATYEETILADTPLAYYRLDELGTAANGDTIADLSGNDKPGTLCYAQGTSPFQPYGWPSPIDTDPASRSFYAFSNNFSHIGSNNRSYIYRPDGDLILPGDFTLECWVKSLADVGSAGSRPFFGVRGSYRLNRTFTGGSDANFRFSLRVTLTDTNIYSLVADAPVSNGVAYHVVGGRLGNALFLYVNAGNLVTLTVPALDNAAESSTPLSLTPCNPPGNSMVIGGLPFNDIDCNVLIDECAIYDYALTGGQVLAHYEAALNELTMRGEANIRTTAVINGADEPDPIAYPFRHNWTEPVVERFRWRSSVFQPVNGPTGLARQRSAPRRQVEYQHLLYSERLRQRFEARGFAGRTALVQFEPDKVLVPVLLTGATTATFDTRYRDFEVGHRVLFYVDDDAYEYATLTAVTDSTIEWDEPLTRDYVRVWVKPARVARLPLAQSLDLVTDVYADASTIYEYQPEDEPLSPRRIVPFTPTLTYNDREVFDLAAWQGHDYAETPTITFTGDRTEVDDGIGIVTAKQYRWGARMVQPYNMNLQGRETIARYLGWLYARAGQSNPFWMPTFRNDLTVVGVAGDELTVSGHDYADLYAAADTRLHLAFVYLDGATTVREIVSVTPDGGNDTLILNAATPTLTNLRWLSFLRRVILSSDDLEIAWETDNVARVAFAVVDAPIDLELGSPSTSPSPSASVSTSTSPSASTSLSPSPSSSPSPSASTSPSPSASISPSDSPSLSPSGSASPSSSTSVSVSPSSSNSASVSLSPSPSSSESLSSSASISPSASPSPSV